MLPQCRGDLLRGLNRGQADPGVQQSGGVRDDESLAKGGAKKWECIPLKLENLSPFLTMYY